MYHVPNPSDEALKEDERTKWRQLWDEVNAYAITHPEKVTEEAPARPHIPTQEELRATYIAAIQTALDTFARTRGYDGILSACSYAASTDPSFAAEAAYCVSLRDATWRAAYDLLDAIQAGTREIPHNAAAVLEELPVYTAAWPEM